MKYHQQLLDNISDAIISTDIRFRIKAWNKAAENLYGYNEKELIGKDIAAIIPLLIPEGKPSSQLSIKSKEFTTAQVGYENGHGQRITIHTSRHTLQNDNDVPIGYLVISRKQAVPATEKHPAMEAHASGEKYRLLFERSSDGIYFFDDKGRILEINARACIMSGYTREELLQKNMFDLVPPDRRAKGAELFDVAKKEGSLYSEGYLLRKDDSVLVVELSTQLTPDGSFICSSRDITERKNTEKALLESEEKYRLLIEQASEGVFVFTKEWDCLDMNSTACEMVGYTREELLTMKVTDLVDPHDLEGTPPRLAQLVTGNIVSAVRRMKRKDGSFFYAESVAQVMPDGRIVSFLRDTTERKQSEIILKESEAKYSSLVDTVDGIVWEADAQTFRFSFVSKQAERLLGYPVEQWINEASFWKDNIHEEDRDTAVNLCIKSTKANQPHELEYRMIAADGRVIWLRDIVSVIAENGHPAKLRGIMIDITKQKKVELELREAETKFRALVEKSLVGVYIILDDKFVYVNPTIETISGYTKEELVGSDLSILIKDEKEMKTIKKHIKSRLSGEKDSVRYEINGMKKDGSFTHIEVFGSRTIYQGKTAIIGTLLDITERKKWEISLRESEERYKLLFDHSPLPMLVMDMQNYQFLDVNDAAVEHYGYSRNEFIGMSAIEIRPSEEVSDFYRRIRKQNPGLISMGLSRHCRKDGTIMDMDIFVHEFYHNNKRSRLVLALDVTEKLKAEKELLHTTKQLRELTAYLDEVREEERTTISREIHDELGQQLTILKMDIAWIAKKIYTLNDDSLVKRSGNALKMLDDTIKTVRRIAHELRPALVEDLGLIAALELQSGEFENRSGVKINFRSNKKQEDLPLPVARALYRIYGEALTNIGRYAKATIVLSSLLFKKDTISLTINDNGQGFDIKTIGNKKTLGLLGMKERTMLLGGRFEINSIPGKGTSISVILPVQKPDSIKK
jgi:PAS domain S-box-containing protein